MTMLNEASIRYAWLFRSNLSHASLDGSDLSGAVLAQADFANASLVRTNLSGASLAKARNLTQAQLDEACGDRPPIKLHKGLAWRSGPCPLSKPTSDEELLRVLRRASETLQAIGHEADDASDAGANDE